MDESDLKSIPLFESLPRNARRVIAQLADEIDAPAGTKLVRQGDFAYEFFVLESGRAEVERDGERIAELGPGDFLGELGIVGKMVRTATVTTTTDAKVIVMTEQAFRSMSRSNPDIASQIEAAVEQRGKTLVS
jgi:CRP-like cAMP-binding protein